jgi:lipase ATG15
VPKDAELWVTSDDGETRERAPTTLRAKASTHRIQRLVDRKPSTLDRLLQHAEIHGEAATLPSSAWTTDEVSGPNITDKETVLSFAKIANNAYTEAWGADDWLDVGGGFNYTEDFGWDEDGLRGHIFADNTNKTVVIGLKGTTMAVFDGMSDPPFSGSPANPCQAKEQQAKTRRTITYSPPAVVPKVARGAGSKSANA